MQSCSIWCSTQLSRLQCLLVSWACASNLACTPVCIFKMVASIRHLCQAVATCRLYSKLGMFKLNWSSNSRSKQRKSLLAYLKTQNAAASEQDKYTHQLFFGTAAGINHIICIYYLYVLPVFTACMRCTVRLSERLISKGGVVCLNLCPLPFQSCHKSNPICKTCSIRSVAGENSKMCRDLSFQDVTHYSIYCYSRSVRGGRSSLKWSIINLPH
jgi:hypothetical protein